MKSKTALTIFLAALALVAAACGGGEGNGETTEPGGDGSPVGSTLSLMGTDALQFEPDAATVSAGEITVELTSESAIQHTFVVEGVNDDAVVVEAAAGQTASGTVELGSDTYTFYCNVPGHREAGMEGTLTVE